MKWFSRAVQNNGGSTAEAPAQSIAATETPVTLPIGAAIVEKTPEPQPVAELPSNLTEALAKIETRQEELNRLFEERLRSDAVQADALRHLHDELQAYRENFVRQAQIPVLKDVIHCLDFVTLEAGRSAADHETALAHLKDMLVDMLFKYDIEQSRIEADDFDRESQQCLRIIPTADASLDRKIAARGLVGFRERGSVLRKEQVILFKFTAPTGE